MHAGDAARAAYAIGYAAATTQHPVAVSERVKAGALAAMAIAHTHPADQVIEATLRLGHLEGTWAVVYDRREKLEHRSMSKVRDGFAQADIDAASIVDDFTSGLPARESVQPDPGVVAAAAEAARAAKNLKATARAHLRTVGRDMTAEATAEGRANALALLADFQSGVTIDFDLAFTDGYDALDGLQSLWDDADGWLARTLQGLTDEVGKALARGWADGLTHDQLITLTQDILDTGGRAAAYVTDLAIGQALSDGSLSVYGAAGLEQADFLTAGDERVCPECDDAEHGNPYDLTDTPAPPLHGMCRCAVAPVINPDTPDTSPLWADYTLEGG